MVLDSGLSQGVAVLDVGLGVGPADSWAFGSDSESRGCSSAG